VFVDKVRSVDSVVKNMQEKAFSNLQQQQSPFSQFRKEL
jgi:hypothetical protein